MRRTTDPPCAPGDPVRGQDGPMSLAVHHIVIDARDLPVLAKFWSEVLGWPILSSREREVIIGPSVDSPIGICFMPSLDDKIVKNRVHLDLNPGGSATPEERALEIQRALALGATIVDVGQRGDESWTVLADPEGNEFCVVRPKADLIG